MPKKSDEEKHRENMVKQYRAVVQVIDGGTPLEEVISEVFHPDVTALYGDILVPFLTRVQEVLRLRGWGAQAVMICEGQIGGASVKSTQAGNVWTFSFAADRELANLGACVGKHLRAIFQPMQGELLPLDRPQPQIETYATEHAAGNHQNMPNLGCADCLFEIAQRRAERAEATPAAETEPAGDAEALRDQQTGEFPEDDSDKTPGEIPPDFDPEANTPEE